jgi:hypothetical protein
MILQRQLLYQDKVKKPIEDRMNDHLNNKMDWVEQGYDHLISYTFGKRKDSVRVRVSITLSNDDALNKAFQDLIDSEVGGW